MMRLEEGLLRAQKMEAIGALGAGIAHDFNNMLGVVVGNTSYALAIIKREHELFDALSDALEAANQAKDLTQQLLTFAKGGEPIKKANCINLLLEESGKLLASGIQAVLEFELCADLWPAEVDAGQFNQVVSNIVINADQAMLGGGVILIKTENVVLEADNGLRLPDGEYVRIGIEDQGIGIDEKDIPEIFDPYFTTKEKGSGLGLASAHSIVTRHAGRIAVDSVVGKGTLFSIYLPAGATGSLEAEIPQEAIHQGRGRILIMDDQEPILRLLERMLNEMGYETEAATGGAQALELYRQGWDLGRRFDLVILDLTVPGSMGGAATLEELLKIDRDAQVVVSSGYSNDPIMANYREYGFCGVVPKPYTRQHLAELLNKLFGEERTRRSRAEE